MRFEHALPEPAGYRAITCAMTIASGYFIGGFVPLVPYMLVDKAGTALYWFIGIMIIALFVFGYVKTCFVIGWSGRRNSLKGAKGGAQMVVVGSVAAGAAMGLVIAFDHHAGAKSGGV
jgi:VIT1/CCC1 family predicted Fe2+/Mn2+ transporter